MNAIGRVQTKWYPEGIRLTLHGTHCMDISINVGKMKISSHLNSIFNRFCSLFVKFYCKTCKICSEKKIHYWINSFIYPWHGSCVTSGKPLPLISVGGVKWIRVFEHSIMKNFNCAYPAIQRGQGSGFLSEGSSWLIACMNEQQRFWWDCTDAQARLNLRCSHRR